MALSSDRTSCGCNTCILNYRGSVFAHSKENPRFHRPDRSRFRALALLFAFQANLQALGLDPRIWSNPRYAPTHKWTASLTSPLTWVAVLPMPQNIPRTKRIHRTVDLGRRTGWNKLSTTPFISEILTPKIIRLINQLRQSIFLADLLKQLSKMMELTIKAI